MSKLDTLHPWFRAKVAQALAYMQGDKELAAMGVKAILTVEAKREIITQIAYYCRGRMKDPSDAKAIFNAAGLWPLSDKEAETPNTWTLKSKHLEGRAVDLAPSRDGKAIWWAAPAPVWERMGLIGESFGLAWGGRWKTKDSPHFEERDT